MDIDAYMVSSSHIVLSVIAEEKKFVTPKKTTYKSKAKTPKAHEKLVEIVDKSKKDVNSTNDGNKSHKTNSGKKYYYRSNKK